MSLARRLAMSLLVLVPLAARADETLDAAALQAQLRDWVAGLMGPGAAPSSHEVQVTAAGDDLRFELPVAGPVGSTGWRLSGDPVIAMAKPLDGGLWAIKSLRLPTPLRAEQDRPPGGRPRDWRLTLAEQTISGQFDPGLTTGSSLAATLRGFALASPTGDDGTQTTRFDRYTWIGGWKPGSEGRVTVTGEGKGENLSILTDGPGLFERVSVTAAALRNSMRVDRLSFERLGAAVRGMMALLPGAAPGPDAAGAAESFSPQDRARLRDLVLAVRDLLGGARQETTLDHLRFEIGGQGGTVASVSFGGAAAATNGIAEVSMRLSVDGVDVPAVRQGPLRDYLPRHLTLAPRVSGIPADELASLLLRALDGDDPQLLQAEAFNVLGKSPLKAGFDDMVLDLGAAVVKASGTVTIGASDDIAGTARIVATGLDGLIRRADTVPDLRGVAPVLLLLKGIGEQKGDATTWKIVYADGQAAVNGTDLSTLLMAPSERRRDRKP